MEQTPVGLEVLELADGEDAAAVGAAELVLALLRPRVGGGAFLAPVAAEVVLEAHAAGEIGAADVALLFGAGEGGVGVVERVGVALVDRTIPARVRARGSGTEMFGRVETLSGDVFATRFSAQRQRSMLSTAPGGAITLPQSGHVTSVSIADQDLRGKQTIRQCAGEKSRSNEHAAVTF